MGHQRPPLLIEQIQPHHVSLVWRAMIRRLRDAELAHDATQDLFVEITRSYARFDPTKGSFEGWMLGFVERTVLRIWREERRRAEPRDDLPEPSADDEPPEQLPSEWLDAVNALPLRHRQLLILRGLEGWSAAATGERLGMSTSNVNTAFARICTRLAKRLELPDAA